MEQDKDEGDNCTCGARHVVRIFVFLKKKKKKDCINISKIDLKKWRAQLVN